MLLKAAVKTSLEEPRKKFLEMTALLRHFGTLHIHLIHTRTKTNYRERDNIQDELDQLMGEIREQGFTVEGTIRNGHAPTVTLDIADEVKADYVAVYWRPKALLRQAVLGSIDSDILRMSNLPVYIHKPSIFSANEELGSVLYATDFKSTDAAVMPYLISSRFRAHTLYLLHVGNRAPDPATEEQRKQRLLANLQRLADECTHAYDTVETIETIGLVHRTIIKTAKSNNVDLVVVGKSEHPDTMSRLIGSTAEILPHKAPCSVFVIPNICIISPEESDTSQIGNHLPTSDSHNIHHASKPSDASGTSETASRTPHAGDAK